MPERVPGRVEDDEAVTDVVALLQAPRDRLARRRLGLHQDVADPPRREPRSPALDVVGVGRARPQRDAQLLADRVA